MQNHVGTSGEQRGAAGLIESSSIDENTRTLKDLVQLLAIKIGAEERNNGCLITAESFAKIIPEFDGESMPVKNWFENFEMNAAAYDLNIKQMYVQARAKMTNTAKLFLDSTYVHQYSEMRMLMETEFSRQYVCSADVHEQLRDRKKRKQESFHEYLLQMKKIASLGNIDARSVIRYVVDGLNMRSDFRYSLYSCKSYKELQEQYEVFDRVIEKPFNPNEGKWTSSQKKQHEGQHDRKRHCFNCGSLDHHRKDCKSAVKCFSCNKEGHMSRDCPGSAAGVQVVRSSSRMKNVTINNVAVECLVDTGADVSILRKYIFNKIPNVTLERCASKLCGLGRKITCTVGYFLAEVAVDKEITRHKFVVVEDEDIEYDALLGFDFVSKFDFSLSADGYKFSSPLGEKACEEPNQMSIYNIINSDDEIDVPPQFAKEVSLLINNYKAVDSVAEVPVRLRIVRDGEIIPFRQSPSRFAIAEKQINEWLDAGIIRPSTSNFASRLVLVNKKDGTRRICVDFRKLNSMVLRDFFPVPIIDEVLQKLQKARFFTVMDLENGFFHVAIEEDSKKFTAFITKSGLYEFNRTPFGFQLFLFVTLITCSKS
ncbi:uncharacterized protein LOC122319644 [Drosophila yakuba]|uniref:uncharacterized protein LOC122319644 n=1 Tax=Drosophila yakuba TaxID=7245 RepID=UPI001C89FF4C|nr:uncharacterized protein LOC122319644 [Drosophila yakuba]